jgi:hypothetical protein
LAEAQEVGAVHRDREDHREEEHPNPGVEESLAFETEEVGTDAFLEDQPGHAERSCGREQARQGAGP